MERPDEQRLAAWRSLLHLHAALVDRLGHELQEERQLPLSWYDVLLNIHEAGGRLRMQELARSVLLSKSGLTRLVDRMESAGLVRREACSGDRRGTFAVLTEEGTATFLRAAPIHMRGIQEHFGAHVDDDEAGVLRTVLDKVLAAQHVVPDCDR